MYHNIHLLYHFINLLQTVTLLGVFEHTFMASCKQLVIRAVNYIMTKEIGNWEVLPSAENFCTVN